MKINKIVFIGVVLIFMSSVAFASPHWSHEEQSTWGAIQDTSQTVVPLNYPYAECSIGKHQSPVDFSAATISNEKTLNKLEIWYDVDTPDFFNSGHGVQVNTSSGYTGELKIGEESYSLIQFHFHEPSEHVVGDKKFPAELHFVHIGEDGRIIVLAVAINEGAENATFQTILNSMPHTEGDRHSNSGIQINPLSLLPPINHQKLDFYSLAGSLTTPPFVVKGCNGISCQKLSRYRQRNLTNLRGSILTMPDHLKI